MNNQTPTISIIMPAYNAENYIAESIESILNQTFKNFELIILNDNSTDSTKSIIEEFEKNDPRIVFINKQNNIGPAHLRNEGFDIAKGDFIALLDADDIAETTRLEKQYNILKNNPQLGVVGSWFTSFGENFKTRVNKHPKNHQTIKARFLIDCTIGNSTGFIRKSVLNNLRYDTNYVPVEDYHLWSKLIAKTSFHIIQESLVKYREHATNISKTKIENVHRSRIKVKKEYLINFGLSEKEQNLDPFITLLEGEKDLKKEVVDEVYLAYLVLINQNKTLNNFDEKELNTVLNKQLVRCVLKSKSIDFKLKQKIRTSSLYTELSFIKKLKFLFKKTNSLF